MGLSYRLTTAYAVWLSTICAFVMWTGLLEWRLSPALAWGLVIGAVAPAIAFDRWVRRTLVPIGPTRRDHRITSVAWVIAAVAIAAYALLWVPAYHHIDSMWDGMTYHMPTIHSWAERGFVHWIRFPSEAGSGWQAFENNLLNGYPKTGEAIGFVLSTLSAGRLVNALNLVFLPLGMLGIAALARELGASRAVAAASGSLFALVPTNVGQAATTYVDTAFSAAAIAYLSILFLQLRVLWQSPRRELPRALAIAGAAPLGLAIGVKGPGLVFAALGCGAVVVASAIRYRRRMKTRNRRLFGTIAGLAMMLAATIPVGGFWYLRNAFIRHNPMNPFEVKVAGHVLFAGSPVKDVIAEEGNTPEFMRPWKTPRRVMYAWTQSGKIERPVDAVIEHNEQGWPIDVLASKMPMWPRSIRGCDPRSGGLGFLWLLGGIPAIAIVLLTRVGATRVRSAAKRMRARRELLAFGLFIGTVAVAFVITPMPWWARYTLWLHGLGLPAVATLASMSLARLARRSPSALFGIVWFLGLVGIGFYEYAYSVKWAHTYAFFMGQPRVNSHSSPSEIWNALTTEECDGQCAIYRMLTKEGPLPLYALGGNAPVGISALSGASSPLLGQLSMPPGRKHWVPVDSDVGADQAAATRFVNRYSPRYIIWDAGAAGIPHVLYATATRFTHFSTLIIFEFGDDPSPPRVLLPKPRDAAHHDGS